jgi:hypothetical protein
MDRVYVIYKICNLIIKIPIYFYENRKKHNCLTQDVECLMMVLTLGCMSDHKSHAPVCVI